MSLCKRCGAAFSCAMQDADPADGAPQPCWCTLLPAALALPDAADAQQGCWCPACLRRQIDEQLAARRVTAPAP